MFFAIRLKTGFFETADYVLSVHPGSIMLSPLDGSAHKTEQIMEDDIFDITFTLKKRFVLEIQTLEKKFVCILQENADNKELHRQFEENIGKRIVFEGM